MMIPIVFLASWIAVDLIGYWLHRWAHVPRSPLYRRHMTHHLVNYPSRRYFSKSYLSSGNDSLALWFAPFAAVYWTSTILYFDAAMWIPIVAGSVPPMVLSSLIHDASHVSKSWVWRIKLLQPLGVMHWVHHRRMNRNYGITTALWDRLFMTHRRPSMGVDPEA